MTSRREIGGETKGEEKSLWPFPPPLAYFLAGRDLLGLAAEDVVMSCVYDLSGAQP